MKNILKKIPAFAVISLIIVLTVVIAIFAASASFGDLNKDNVVDDKDVELLMQSIVGSGTVDGDLANFQDDDDVINVLDVIALKRYIFSVQHSADGWTTFWY